ncbi:MAG: hypothetical protein WA131_10540 [Desulfitobacteriaceae bacterium]
MDFPKDEQLRLWSKYLALVTASLICLLSWKNGVTLGWTLVRAASAFLVIYSLTLGSILLFMKTAYPDSDEEVLEQKLNQGTLIDISLGDDSVERVENTYSIDQKPDFNENESVLEADKIGVGTYAGQVDPALVSGVGHQQQADIVRRMGWDE